MSRLSRNVVWNLVGQAALVVLVLVAARFVLRRLGEDAFGLIFFALTLNSVLVGLLDLGISATTVRVVAVTGAGGDGATGYLRTAALFYWCAYLVLAGCTYLAAPVVVVRWTHLSGMAPEPAADLVRLLLLGSLSTLPRSLYASCFRGIQRMEFNNAIEVGMNALQQAGTIAVLLLAGGPMQVAGWFVCCYAAAIAVYAAALTRFLPARSLLPGYSHAAVRAHWRYAAHLSGISVLSMVHTQADKVVIANLLPIGSFGSYAVAAGMVSRVSSVAAAVAQAAFPSLSALFRDGDRERVLGQYRRLQDLVCYGAAFPMAAIAFAALPAFTYLFGRGLAEQLQVPTALLCLGYYLSASVTAPYVASLAAGRPALAARLNVLALFTFLPALVVLVTRFGMTGAALAWIGYQLLSYGYFVPRVCRTCLGIGARAWYAHVGRVLALAGATYGVAWLLAMAVGGGGVAAWSLSFLAATLAFATAGYRMIGEPLRSRLVSLLPAR